MIKPINKFKLIKPLEKVTSLDNGLLINSETQSRKDIISGTCLVSGDTLFFPLYAASTLLYKGNEFLVVHEDDIMCVDDSRDNN